MDFPHSRYSVKIIKEGYYIENNGQIRGASPIVLVHGPHNVLVGTGLPQDKDLLQRGLQENGVSVENVEYVVCNSCNIENIGNLNLFPSATHIVGFDISIGDARVLHDFSEDIPFEIDDDVEVVATPGHHDGGVVSVIVSCTPLGTIAIAGGVFHSEADLEDPDLWVQESRNSEVQHQSRINILKMADHVVPRYGSFFRIPDSYKSSGMPVVLTP